MLQHFATWVFLAGERQAAPTCFAQCPLYWSWRSFTELLLQQCLNTVSYFRWLRCKSRIFISGLLVCLSSLLFSRRKGMCFGFCFSPSVASPFIVAFLLTRQPADFPVYFNIILVSAAITWMISACLQALWLLDKWLWGPVWEHRSCYCMLHLFPGQGLLE